MLGRDFDSRGMETCRGSIPPLWLLRMGVVKLFGLTGTRQESEDADDKGTGKLML